MIIPDELVTIKTIAERFFVDYSTAKGWVTRYSDFPEPVVPYNGNSRAPALYSWVQVSRWKLASSERDRRMTEESAARRERNTRARVQRIFPGDGDPRHGTVNGYNNLKCHCGDCRAAWATRMLDYLDEKPERRERHNQRERKRREENRKKKEARRKKKERS